MDDAAARYRLRAEECLALALEARDDVHRTEAVEMALYWFEQAEQAKNRDGGPRRSDCERVAGTP